MILILLLLSVLVNTQLIITSPDTNTNTSLNTARTITNNTDVSNACNCDIIKGLCEQFCCCDPICAQASIDVWIQNNNCLPNDYVTFLKYPICANLVRNELYSSEYKINSVNDILCVVEERLPYSGVYRNLEDSTNADTDKLTFDKDTKFMLYNVLNDSQPGVTTTTPKYSGNPGYRMGLPLMLGIKGTNTITWAQPLKLQAWKSDLTCGLTSETNIANIQVNFGEDISIQCIIPVAQFDTYCSGTSTSTFQIFNNFKYNGEYLYVGRWGSSKYARITEWIQIIQQAVSSNITQTNYCSNVFTKQLTIMYQKTGFVGDLQNYIIKVVETDIPNYVYLSSQAQALTLTYNIRYEILTTTEIDPTATKSFRDSITPYVQKIFKPFNFQQAILVQFIIIIFIL